MRPRNWAKVAVGLLLIGGVFTGLWIAYQPQVTPLGRAREPPPPKLRASRALVRVVPGRGALPGGHEAAITCDGDRRLASGFWANHPVRACDALASTRAALVSGPGCPRLTRQRVALVVTGAFGPRRFHHVMPRDGCGDPDRWLAVEALALPVLFPDRKIAPRARGG